MAKLWKVLKVIIFGVGAITLALIAFGLITTLVLPRLKSAKHQQVAAPMDEIVFDKQEGALKLVVKRREAEGHDEYLMTLSKGGAPIAQNYRVPVEKYHLEYVSFYDAALIPVRESEYRIVLFSDFEGEEGSSENHIWFMKVTDTVNVREVISLSDVHRQDANGLVILGNKTIGMPYQKSFRSEAFVVPVMVRVGENISISPLLSPAGADVLHTALEQEINARMAWPSDGKEEKRGEQYQKARKGMSEALSEKTIVY
jgi:hypothetical protein